ncbi:hypothetical protein NT2_02_02900 [Caenibius tardaugens NBRC 16725]|uniref:Lipoprotein n=1 Tax=Caenibius tardaugens NBRC 16725 TaxID=1219035 RepID=U3A0A9_9SPHN|nr:hypothetical protein [Caenibius tardaugens]AZI34694.1 hypothetical protein EGO55_00990 [Caenibius tardaugens NBRC 16725]GAD48208.1 hypothetical protein NT2_02_02900 [Caenibius tardaugens NBRC 16725]
MRIGLLVLPGLAALISGCGTAGEESLNKSFDEEFRSSCVSSAVKTGAPPPLAARACACTIDEINAKYSTREKLALSQDEIMPIIEACANKTVQR